MPPVSQAQRAAMHAAAEGHSTIGIPQSVGQEFSQADPGGKLPAHAPAAHRPASSLEAMTGLRPGKRKIRRGGGRHKAPAAKSAAQHLEDVKSHLTSGNHQAAKSSAFQLVRALHSLAGPKQPAQPPASAQPGFQPPQQKLNHK